jgi:uncharacterized protein YqjF (DUF2071 family)
MPSTFLTAEWRKLIMAQYEVDPVVLTPYLPPGVELDFYRNGTQSRCYVSLVGFLFDRVRVKGVAIPFHTRFEEVNLRFYVTRTEPGGATKRGVVFIREFVPRAAITWVANSIYEEPYATLAMRHSIVASADTLNVRYDWRHRVAGRSTWHSLAVEAEPTPQPIAPDSEEEFLTEHYWGYTKRSRGSTSEYGVVHPRWSIYPIRSFSIQADFAALYGPEFAHLDHAAPASILLAEGSSVSVLQGTRLPAI